MREAWRHIIVLGEEELEGGGEEERREAKEEKRNMRVEFVTAANVKRNELNKDDKKRGLHVGFQVMLLLTPAGTRLA